MRPFIHFDHFVQLLPAYYLIRAQRVVTKYLLSYDEIFWDWKKKLRLIRTWICKQNKIKKKITQLGVAYLHCTRWFTCWPIDLYHTPFSPTPLSTFAFSASCSKDSVRRQRPRDSVYTDKQRTNKQREHRLGENFNAGNPVIRIILPVKPCCQIQGRYKASYIAQFHQPMHKTFSCIFESTATHNQTRTTTRSLRDASLIEPSERATIYEARRSDTRPAWIERQGQGPSKRCR